MTEAGTLVLVRHGQSAANAAGIFTGMLDVPLTELGREEATRAAELLNEARLWPEVCLSSPLRRAQETTAILRERLHRPPTTVETDWRLSERHYGALTGRSKTGVLQQYGQAQFQAWRRSVDSAPPPMTPDQHGTLSAPFLEAGLGNTESLRDVIARVDACYQELIEPVLRSGWDVLVVAHGNSLRAMCTILDQLDDADAEALNLPTGTRWCTGSTQMARY